MLNRFFLEKLFNSPALLTGAELNHLHVMRVKIGDTVDLVDGQGRLARARVDDVDKKSALLNILNVQTYQPPFPPVFLAMPILKIPALEWAVEKATELGADAIRIFPAERSEKKQLTRRQTDRLRLIAISAMKQCGRYFLPEIRWCDSLQQAFLDDVPVFFGDPNPAAPWLTSRPSKAILICTGPEKGFSPNEIEQLNQKGRPIRLHTNVLRAETAPLVALSLLTQQRIEP